MEKNYISGEMSKKVDKFLIKEIFKEALGKKFGMLLKSLTMFRETYCLLRKLSGNCTLHARHSA